MKNIKELIQVRGKKLENFQSLKGDNVSKHLVRLTSYRNEIQYRLKYRKVGSRQSKT